MHTSAVQKISATSCLLEEKSDPLGTTRDILVITKNGAGQILDLNKRGLSFGCLYPHQFSDKLHLDILGNNNIFVKNIKVKKQRECFKKTSGKLANFELVVGVEFVDPSPRLNAILDFLINTHEQVARSSYDPFCSATDCFTNQRQVADCNVYRQERQSIGI